MDRVILGDNQFFGVNHMSEERGMERMRRFQDTARIIETIDVAYDCGVRGFSFSTHDRVKDICDHFRAHPKRYADLRLYPGMPYAHKYAHLVNEKGVLGAIKEVVLADNTAGGVAGMVMRGGAIALTQDSTQIMKLLVDAEMKMFRGLNVEVVFLQNIVTDLLLGLGWLEVFADFVQYVEDRHKCRAGFMTLNMPRLVDALHAAGIEDPVVCSAINKVGFQMNPGVAAYEETLRTKRVTAFAMSIMAAGAIPPREAIEYVAGLENVTSVMFGASSRRNIEQTRDLLVRGAA